VSEVTLLVTGRLFGGRGFRGVMPVMEELIHTAERELHIMAYVVSRTADPILRAIETAVRRGIRLTCVLNQIPGEDLELREYLLQLQSEFPHLTCRVFEDSDRGQLHAKVLVADRRQAVVGSANFTWSGLTVNHEIGIQFGGKAAWELAAVVDNLFLSSADL
jgi:phosphatidylserine/phosphatidylglycerophosphate/cardiolipin synthase-like enzyme